MRKQCIGCGVNLDKGYFIVDEFEGSSGHLCPECFDLMCFNRIRDRLEGVMTISMNTLKYEFRLGPRKVGVVADVREVENRDRIKK